MFTVTDHTGPIYVLYFTSWSLPDYLSRNISEEFFLSSGIQRSVVRWMSTDFSVSGFSLVLLFNPKDGGNMFLRNISWHSTNYTALYLERHNSSQPPLRVPQILRRNISVTSEEGLSPSLYKACPEWFNGLPEKKEIEEDGKNEGEKEGGMIFWFFMSWIYDIYIIGRI
jgi:hypothetical protein